MFIILKIQIKKNLLKIQVYRVYYDFIKTFFEMINFKL
jgi:hypothetical protein